MSFVIKVDTDFVGELAEQLANTHGNIAAGVARGVNAAAAVVREDSVSQVVSQVNLTKTYVDPKLTVAQNATPEKPVAVLSVPTRGLSLANFDATQQSVANVWTEAMFAEKFGSTKANVRPNPKAPSMPWTPRKGDPLRKIQSGKKQAGITVRIKTAGGTAAMPHVFLMPMRGQNGKFGVFGRPKGGGKAKAKYGPSVDQVLKGVWRADEQTIAEKLGDSVMSEVSNEITKGLAK